MRQLNCPSADLLEVVAANLYTTLHPITAPLHIGRMMSQSFDEKLARACCA